MMDHNNSANKVTFQSTQRHEELDSNDGKAATSGRLQISRRSIRKTGAVAGSVLFNRSHNLPQTKRRRRKMLEMVVENKRLVVSSEHLHSFLNSDQNHWLAS